MRSKALELTEDVLEVISVFSPLLNVTHEMDYQILEVRKHSYPVDVSLNPTPSTLKGYFLICLI